MTVGLEDEYVHLAADGSAQAIPGGAAFWSLDAAEMRQFENGWLVTEFVSESDWDNWEMHPNGEELVYLLSGDIEFLQELASGTTATRLTGRGAVLVPRGVWHTARVMAPSRMLFVTHGAGTRHRAVRAA